MKHAFPSASMKPHSPSSPLPFLSPLRLFWAVFPLLMVSLTTSSLPSFLCTPLLHNPLGVISSTLTALKCCIPILHHQLRPLLGCTQISTRWNDLQVLPTTSCPRHWPTDLFLCLSSLCQRLGLLLSRPTDWKAPLPLPLLYPVFLSPSAVDSAFFTFLNYVLFISTWAPRFRTPKRFSCKPSYSFLEPVSLSSSALASD